MSAKRFREYVDECMGWTKTASSVETAKTHLQMAETGFGLPITTKRRGLCVIGMRPRRGPRRPRKDSGFVGSVGRYLPHSSNSQSQSTATAESIAGLIIPNVRSLC